LGRGFELKTDLHAAGKGIGTGGKLDFRRFGQFFPVGTGGEGVGIDGDVVLPEEIKILIVPGDIDGI